MQNQPDEKGTNAQAGQASNRTGLLVKIPLPVDSKSAAKIKLTLKRIAETAPQVVRPEERQVVVLEFDTQGGKTGRGSELEACQSLARFLASSDMNRVESIAYIPADSRSEVNGSSQLNGHAVLIAIAANQIAMDQGTSIGKAGIDEENVAPLVQGVYRGVASQRLTLPVPIVMSMLNGNEQLFRVRTDEGTVYVHSGDLRKLEESGKAIETNTISQEGEMALLTSQQLADFRLLRYRVSTRTELAGKLNLSPHSLEGSPANEEAWRAVQVDLPPYIDTRTTQWIIRSLGSQSATKNAPNLVIFNIDGNDGNVDACLSLARYLVDLDTEQVQTVAFVRQSARGPLGLVALSCDQLVMASDARLGGHLEMPEENKLDPDGLADLKPMIMALARDKQQDWSLLMAMIDPNLPVTRFRNTDSGQVRLLGEEELRSIENADQWAPLGPVDVGEGLTALAAEQMFVARTIAEDIGQVKSFYQLDEIPRSLRPSATDRWVERVAVFLAAPAMATLLLFMGMFFFSSEMSAPGLGVPGFLSAMCFMLFFWSQHLDGNAHWLEIILFLVGVVFIGMEIFVIPGFGIFGIGGLLMVVVSLVLASQSFIVPSTSEELARLPQSLMPLVGAGFGFFAAIIALRKVLPNSPYLKLMMLNPREKRADTGMESANDPEAIVDWSYLEGETGETVTRLFPAGKARISGKVYDVITDGRMVDKGQQIEVVEAIGNRVVVKPLDDDV